MEPNTLSTSTSSPRISFRFPSNRIRFILRIICLSGSIFLLPAGAGQPDETHPPSPSPVAKVENSEFSQRSAPANPEQFAGPPRLIIEPQGHSGIIHQVLFTPDGSTLISLGEDKTIRFWDVETGELRRTIRGFIEDGLSGTFYCGAISPDGATLAVGGILMEALDGRGTAIYVIDIESGELVRTLKGHSKAVRDLRFRGNKVLFSGSMDNTIRMWFFPDTEIAGPDTAEVYGDVFEGHKGPVTSVRPIGQQLLSASFDNKLHAWKQSKGSHFFEYDTSIDHHQDKVLAMEVAPDESIFASGSLDGTLILYKPHEGKTIGLVKNSSPISAIGFSPDSKFLAAPIREEGEKTIIGVFETGSRKLVREVAHHNNAISDIAWHPTKKLIASAGGNNHSIVLWNPDTGEVVRTLGGSGASGFSVAFDRAGQNRIAFGQTVVPDAEKPINHMGPLTRVFDFTEMALTPVDPKEAENQFRRAITNFKGNELKYVDQYKLQAGEVEVPNDPAVDAELYCASFTNDGDLVIGSRLTLRLLGHGGLTKAYEFKGHEGNVFAVSPSPDGRQLASIGLDQTIRLWNVDARGGELKRSMNHPQLGGGDAKHWIAALKEFSPAINGKPITSQDQLQQLIDSKNPGESLTLELGGKPWNFFISESRVTTPVANLFVGTDGEWVCWLPSGHYQASAGGEKYIGWHFNRGVEKTGRFFPSFVFREQYHHPELVKRTIQLGDFDRAVAEVGINPVEKLAEQVPPNIAWVQASASRGDATQSRALVQAQIHSPNSELTEIKLLLNGKAIETEKVNGGELLNFERSVELVPGENRLAIYAANRLSGHLSDERIIHFTGEAPSTKVRTEDLPNLYLLAIGVSKYTNSDLNLDYCNSDATEIERVLKAQEGKAFGKVESRLLLDEAADRLSIIENLEWLEQNATHRDVVVVFVASHGVNDNRGNYYLIPTDCDFDSLRSKGVAATDFVDVLGNLPAKTLVFLDTCRSGQLGVNLNTLNASDSDSTEAIRALTSQENGVIVMAASTGQEDSVEHSDWGHGAFTMALLEGIEGGHADFAKDGIVFVRELDLFVSEKVIELTRGIQHPTTVRPSTISRFPVARVW